MTSGKAGFCTSCRSLVGRDDEKSCPDCGANLVMLQDEVLESSEQEPAPSIEQPGQRITLSPTADISFGTSNDCDHRVDAQSSDYQASVVYRQADEAYWIIDYGKQRPRTWVNRDPVKSRKLKYGDLVQVAGGSVGHGADAADCLHGGRHVPAGQSHLVRYLRWELLLKDQDGWLP